MSRIKEFYHDEICKGFDDAEADILSDEFLNDEQEAVEAQIAKFENDKAEVETSGVPKYFHSKF